MATSDIGKGAFLNVKNKDTGEIEKKTLIPPAPSDGDLGGISEEKLVQITKNKEKISSLNAELTDGRTDVDGEVHKNIGDAMRGQARKLRENLVVRQKEQPTDPNNNVWISDEDDEVEVPDMGEFNSLKEDIINSDVYVNQLDNNGEIKLLYDLRYYDSIIDKDTQVVVKKSKIVFNSVAYGGNVTYILNVTPNKNYTLSCNVSKQAGSVYSSIKTIDDKTIFENQYSNSFTINFNTGDNKTIKIIFFGGNTPCVDFELSNIVLKKAFITQQKLNSITSNSNKIELNMINGKYISSNGVEVEHNAYSCTDLINISGADKIYINNVLGDAYVAFYDVYKRLIKTYGSDGNTSNYDFMLLNVPPTAYYTRVSKYNELDTDLNVYIYNISTFTQNKSKYKVSKFNIGDFIINYYNNILFCGDSVTAGLVCEGTAENPNIINSVLTDYSYPTQFSKIFPKANITVKARSGITAVQWLNDFFTGEDFSKYNLIIIELGYNAGDNNYLDISDINVDGTNTNAYKKIVSGIRAQNDEAEIVLVRSSHYEWTKNWMNVLNALSTEYYCKIIDLTTKEYIDLDSEVYHGYYDANNVDWAHFTKKGYVAKAYDVANKISDVLSLETRY